MMCHDFHLMLQSLQFACFQMFILVFGSSVVRSCLGLFRVIMAQADRWTFKILSLPIFDRSFTEAIAQTPLVNPTFVIALGAATAGEFTSKVGSICESFDTKVAEVLSNETDKLEQFWSLITASEKLFLESSTQQLGFGLCETRSESTRDLRLDELRKEAMIKALVSKPTAPNKRLKSDQTQSSSTPLLDKENAEKARWAGRLEAIGKRAGAEAKLLSLDDQSEDLTDDDLAKLKRLVLLSGAPRTMAVHVRAFERYEIWASMYSLDPHPLHIDKILKYALTLDQRECGPSVIPALKTSFKWVAARLAIELPDLDDRRLRALQESVIAKRAKTLKEAVPFPIPIVGLFEAFVCDETKPEASRLFVWWILCMIFASLRFDDAIHVRPFELVMQEEGLFGVAWQTKVDRKRAGTKLVVPSVGFREKDWLVTGWNILQKTDLDRDYWIPELNTREAFLDKPPTYLRTVQWIRFFAYALWAAEEQAESVETMRIRQVLKDITAHSCRVTLLDAAVHAGRSTEEIGLQANWKNPGPLVLKYTRNRSSVPAMMIKQLVNELVQANHPAVEDENTILTDSADSDLDGTEFFTKNKSTRSYYDYKLHATALGDPSVLACNKFEISECTSIGNVLPDLAVLCKACAKARPDICKFYEPDR